MVIHYINCDQFVANTLLSKCTKNKDYFAQVVNYKRIYLISTSSVAACLFKDILLI